MVKNKKTKLFAILIVVVLFAIIIISLSNIAMAAGIAKLEGGVCNCGSMGLMTLIGKFKASIYGSQGQELTNEEACLNDPEYVDLYNQVGNDGWLEWSERSLNEVCCCVYKQYSSEETEEDDSSGSTGCIDSA